MITSTEAPLGIAFEVRPYEFGALQNYAARGGLGEGAE